MRQVLKTGRKTIKDVEGFYTQIASKWLQDFLHFKEAQSGNCRLCI